MGSVLSQQVLGQPNLNHCRTWQVHGGGGGSRVPWRLAEDRAVGRGGTGLELSLGTEL